MSSCSIAATDRVIASLASHGDFPVKLRVSHDGNQAWVANNRSGTVAVFDVPTRRLNGTVEVGQRPLGLAFSPDSRYAFVTRPGDNEVVQIDTQSFEIVRRVPTGNGPDGVLWIGGEYHQ